MAELLGTGTAHAAAALLFMTAVMTTLDAYSTFQSSPWTVENFGGDQAKMRACREYLGHAVGFSMVYSVASSLIARSPWPVVGSVISNGYLIWLYRRAMQRGAASGSTNWAKGTGQ